MNKLYEVGSYIRLSKENTFADSESIEHQQEMLSKFIAVIPGWIDKKQYIDNGVSGGTFDRPAFSAMMEDVRSGVINLVLVKDLSRFGRNYLEAGKYLEDELPSHGCRFVALSDGIDTEDGENDIIPFLNAMNDYYLKNLSDRIKIVLHAKARDGQKLTGAAPYGYIRSPENHMKLIIDEYAAGIVKQIFALRTGGAGYAKIAAAMNTDGVLAPRLYYFVRQNKEPTQKTTPAWYSQTVRAILQNEIYIGNIVQCKRKTRSYRDKTIVNCPEEEWIRVENTHEAIVDMQTWEQVQQMGNKAKQRASGQREHRPSLFSGLLFCDCCGSGLDYSVETHTRKGGIQVSYGSYYCRKYALTGKAVCSRHTISELSLKKILLEDIRNHANRIKLDETAVLKLLQNKLLGEHTLSRAEVSIERRALRKQLHALEQLTSKLYEDRVSGVISEDSFSIMIENNEVERLDKEQQLALLERSEKETTAKLEDIEHWLKLIREKSLVEDVDRELLEALVEKVVIGEREVINGVKHQNVSIYYRFIGLF